MCTNVQGAQKKSDQPWGGGESCTEDLAFEMGPQG